MTIYEVNLNEGNNKKAVWSLTPTQMKNWELAQVEVGGNLGASPKYKVKFAQKKRPKYERIPIIFADVFADHR